MYENDIYELTKSEKLVFKITFLFAFLLIVSAFVILFEFIF